MDDVLIFGSGLGGSMLAATLAAKGLSVLMIDAETHPRFAIGEATTPDTSFRLKLLALRSGVPEIAALASFDHLRDEVGPSHGVKRAFSFVYHHPGKAQQPEESHQYPTMAPPMGPDCHLFRQDTDAWMMAVAVRYGARIHQRCRATNIEIADDGVTVQTSDGRTLKARFLVDAAGFRSPLVDKLGLREGAPKMFTNARSIFTHMVNVPPFDLFTPGVKKMGLHYPLCQSTLHHCFPGGWMWVIPFNNHPEQVNPLCSVGIMFDRDMYPDSDVDGETQFRDFVAQYPSMKAHFADAVAVRPWINTKRIQYNCREMVGDRWALMAHSAAFIDPLYSSGINLTVSVVDQLTTLISEACADNRFERARFLPVQTRFHANIDLYDRLVANSYRAWSNFDLWDAWYRVWVIGLLNGGGVNGNLFMRHLEGHPPDPVADMQISGGLLGSGMQVGREFLDEAFATFEKLKDGVPDSEVASQIRAIFARTPCSPTFWNWHDPKNRATPPFTLLWMTRLHRHYHKHGPAEIRDGVYNWKIPTALSFLWGHAMDQRRRTRGRGLRYLWEALFTQGGGRPPGLDGMPPRQIRSEPV